MEWFLSFMALPAALALDFLVGDPVWRYHPVRIMGKAVEWAEPKFRKLPFPEVFSGALFAVFLIGSTFVLAFFVMCALWSISAVGGFIAETVIFYFCLSARELERSALVVFRALRQGNLHDARRGLAMIVGRDVAGLQQPGICRATVETVAENLVDGVISSLFFAALGGAPMALAFKMVNTLDSMVGYKNEIYREFGKAAARIDDAANFLPARMSVLFTAAAAWILAARGAQSFKTGMDQGCCHSSPNAGYPEAAFAGALGVRLGGPSRYRGRLVEKPWIGANFPMPCREHIPRACDLMLLTSVISLLFFTPLAAIVRM